MSQEKINIQHNSSSIFEHYFDDEDILHGCKFLLPTSFSDQFKRFLNKFGYKRKDITYKKYKQITQYLQKKGVISHINTSSEQLNSLPISFKVKAYHSEKVYGYSAEYEKPTGEALAVSLGELLERYFTFRNVGWIKSFKLNHYFIKKIELSRFNSYLGEQKINTKHLEDTKKINYVTCNRISTNKKMLIPSQFIYWEKKKDEKKLIDQTTNGGGAFYNKDEAMLSGVYELIQRDNFFMMWLPKKIKKNILIDSIPKESKSYSLVSKTISRGIEIFFVIMNHDIDIQSIGCLLIDSRGNEKVAGFGASTGYNLDNCLITSLKEALTILSYNTTNSTLFNVEKYKPFTTNGIGRKERLTIWKGDMVKNLKFLSCGENISYHECKKRDINFNTKKDELAYVIKIIESKGKNYHVYVHEVKSTILKKLGYHVVRIVIPALFPLYLEETSATLSSTRLADALGIKKEEIKIHFLNPYPHPFP